ncbi:MAG: SDR family oxidoreductase [Lachnospiraceae bacterium]|nr:SDR family oxidoreductase [Lachnospiraceae bacterium]
MNPAQDCKTKTVLITGASRGIGKAIAEAFARLGYQLILTCHHSQEALALIKEDLEKRYGVKCRIMIGDIGDYSFVEELFSSVDKLDVLINNAGISHIGLLSDMTPAQWHRIIQTNLDSVFYTCKFAVPLMVNRKSGKIINISSVWGSCGASMEVAYSATKGGVNAFTKALAKELAPSNIQVNAVSCGVIDTDMNRCFSTEERKALIDEIPADRFGTPEEVANVVLSLCDTPSYLTGQIITVDGGWI